MRKFTQLLLLGLVLLSGVMLDLAPINVPDGIDKIYHFIGFALITVIAISTFVSFFGKKLINFFLMLLLIFGGIFAGISEFLQEFVAIRDSSAADWMTNLLGISIVVLIDFIKYSKEKKNSELIDGRFEFKDLPFVV